MARRTVGSRKRSTRRRVRRVIRLLPRRQMAPGIPAIIRLNRQIVIVVDVAVRASSHFARGRQLVRTCQREACRAVIKIRRLPRNRVVASRARRNWKYRRRRRMLGIRRLLPGRQVAPGIPAVRRGNLQAVIPANMAVRTGNIGVAVGEGKIDGWRRVVHGGPQPAVKIVAGIAGPWKLRGYVIWIGGLLKLGQMTRDTIRGKTLKLADSSALVAILALYRRVRPQQRKAILVILDLLYGNVPALHRVALGAVRAHLALMHVRVAVLTLLAHVGKDGLNMALRALHFFVHASQRVAGFVVIEFRRGANGLPTRRRVTVLTRYLERSMRAPRRLPLRFRPCRCCRLPKEKGQPEHDLDQRGIDSHLEPSIFPRKGWGT